MKKLIILILAALLPIVATAADTDSSDSPSLTKKEQRRTLRGFRCYIDAGYIFRLEKYGGWILFGTHRNEKSSNLFTNIAAGYQFNNFFFLGAGTGVAYLTNTNKIGMPFFGNARVNVLNGRYSPFLEVKMGKVVGFDNDLYTSGSIGVRMMLKNKKAINFGVEASAIFEIFSSDSNDSLGVGLKLGYEF